MSYTPENTPTERKAHKASDIRIKRANGNKMVATQQQNDNVLSDFAKAIMSDNLSKKGMIQCEGRRSKR